MDVMEMFRKKFEDYRRLVDEGGEEHARATLMEGYPERQKKNMGPFFDGCTLYEGFKKAANMGHRDAQDYLKNTLHIALK